MDVTLSMAASIFSLFLEACVIQDLLFLMTTRWGKVAVVPRWWGGSNLSRRGKVDEVGRMGPANTPILNFGTSKTPDIMT